MHDTSLTIIKIGLLRQRRAAIIENLSGRRASCLEGEDNDNFGVLYVNVYPT